MVDSRPRSAPDERPEPLLRRVLHLLLVPIALIASGCVFEPEGFEDEQARAQELGRDFESEFASRPLPELDTPATWRPLLARAFAANGELEAAWFEWSAALERVRIAGGWPDTPLAPSFGYLVSEHRMKFWDRTTLGVGFDPMKNLSWPTKVTKAAEVALEEARSAGLRFEAAKFALQRRVLQTWLDVALLEEEIRIQGEQVELARAAAESALLRVRTGAAQRELLRANVELELAQNDLLSLQARLSAAKADLNALVARPADAPLDLAPELPEPRPIPVGDAELLEAGVARNAELAALAAQVRGREDAVELARRQFIPDFNPFIAFTGDVTEMVGVGVSLPTMIPQLRAAVAESRAMLREAGAMARQAQFERGGQFVAALTILRNAERQTALLRDVVLPTADRALRNVRESYATGRAILVEVIDAQSTLLGVRRGIAEARIEREMRLAELEELGGFDVEALANSADGDDGANGASEEDSDVPSRK